MLETPLFGRFIGENKYLVFAPASIYLWLVGGCVFGGLFVGVWGVLGGGLYWSFVGAMVLMAGLWAALSLQWISFNLREKIYTRRQGPGFFPQTTRGAFQNLEVIFLLAEERLVMSRHVTYRLLLQWRGRCEPPMILQQTYYAVPPGQPLNFAAGTLYHLGARVAQALGVPLVDRAHVSSPCPV